MEATAEKQLEDLETLHRIQVENGRHYFWVEENDHLHSVWQARADETKQKILDFKEKHDITTKNWWEI
jgi:hypothetical protein